MWRRVTCAVQVTSGAVSTRNAAKRAQGQVGAADAARAQDAADLGQVAAHRGHDLRERGLQLGPARQQAHPVGAPLRRPVHRRLPVTAAGPAACRRRPARRSPRPPCGTGRRASHRPGAGRSGSTRSRRARPGPAPPPAPSRPPAAGSGRCAAAHGRSRAPARPAAAPRPGSHPSPLADSGCPRRGPFSTTNTRSVPAPGGRSPSR